MNMSLQRLLVPALVLAMFGFGCQKATPDPILDLTPSGPKTAVFANLAPAEATKKITLTNRSVISLRQNFSNGGEKLAATLGWGPSVMRDIVIRRFAPGNSAELEWKLATKVQVKDKSEDRQQTGSIVAIDIKQSYELLLPAYWTQGERNAASRSAIWLSNDVYENFSKAQASTFLPGTVSKEILDLMAPSKEVKAAALKVETELKKRESKQPIDYATSEPDLANFDVNVNGQRVTVQVMNIKSWYGNFIVLANPQNPIILKFTPSKEFEALGMPGFFGYEVTDFKDIQE